MLVNGLTSGTTYYFRSLASNWKGEVWSDSSLAFTTVSDRTINTDENEPIGSILAELNATDSSSGAITYRISNGDNNSSLFSIESNGTLKNAIFWIMNLGILLTVTVQAKNENNVTTYQNITVILQDVNDPPSHITASNLTIAENSTIGKIIGEFNATDPDGDSNITYSLVPPFAERFEPFLWLDASDASTITHSSGSVSQWADKSGNAFHFTQTTAEKTTDY